VDPIYHTTKSSGQIINKIETTTKEMEGLVVLIVENLLPTVIGFITVVVTMASFDYRLGIIGTISFFVIAFMSIAINYLNAEVFKKKRIKADDKSRSKAVETLQQNALIRASFASNEQIESLKSNYLNSININSITQQAFGLTRTFTRTAYAISNLVVGMVLFELVNTNQINTGVGLSLLIAYFNGSGPIMRVGNMIRNSIQSISRQEDLFDFIRQFGVQTYPVLEGDKIDENVALQIQELEEKQKEYLDGKK
jgi:ABC-type multidrug transport system fused ATPase/permease subunit